MSDHVQSCVVCPPHNPRSVEGGALVCFGCSNRILRHLRELEDYLPTLPLIKTRRDTSRGSPGFRSTPPANLTSIVHTDPRSDSSDREGNLTDELGALGFAAAWTRVVIEEHGVTPPSTAYLGLALLRRNHNWISCQPWVDEYAQDLRRVHGAVRAAAGDPLPRKVGHCLDINCDGDVYEEIETGSARCARCPRKYAGLQLLKLQLAQEAS